MSAIARPHSSTHTCSRPIKNRACRLVKSILEMCNSKSMPEKSRSFAATAHISRPKSWLAIIILSLSVRNILTHTHTLPRTTVQNARTRNQSLFLWHGHILSCRRCAAASGGIAIIGNKSIKSINCMHRMHGTL